jgi:hypothetical protein
MFPNGQSIDGTPGSTSIASSYWSGALKKADHWRNAPSAADSAARDITISVHLVLAPDWFYSRRGAIIAFTFFAYTNAPKNRIRD